MTGLLITICLPIFSGGMYFYLAWKVHQIAKVRSIMFGEIRFQQLQFAFTLFGIYFLTRPLQNILGPYPMPLIVNCVRQLFLMAYVAPSILVAIFHWAPTPSGAPKSSKFAAYAVGSLMGIIFVLINTVIGSESKVIFSSYGLTLYDGVWQSTLPQLVMIHLICQLISPVGFLILASSYIKHRRYEYTLAHIYNQMPLKWKYLEASCYIFGLSFVLAGVGVAFGGYYTYLWSIYFIGSIASGFFALKSITIPPRKAPQDLQS
ncbi:MAG: hypothetical protein LBC07_01990 [Elusimicrobiota bacterium]|jgi:hypothetical protein|nr:hypothetical protein [Elusimicrobiota bacterium]